MPDEDTTGSEAQTEKNRSSLLWVSLATLLAVGTYAAMLIPAIAGQPPKSISAYSSMLWSGVLFVAIWRYRRKNGWIGLGVGLAFGVIMFALAVFISNFAGAGPTAT